MAKKVPAPKKPVANASQPLLDAIATVKHLQGFIQAHGSLQQALETVSGVNALIELTGGVEQLKQALEIVGRDETPAAPQE
jgi:hypothetical protein